METSHSDRKATDKQTVSLCCGHLKFHSIYQQLSKLGSLKTADLSWEIEVGILINILSEFKVSNFSKKMKNLNSRCGQKANKKQDDEVVLLGFELDALSVAFSLT